MDDAKKYPLRRYFKGIYYINAGILIMRMSGIRTSGTRTTRGPGVFLFLNFLLKTVVLLSLERWSDYNQMLSKNARCLLCFPYLYTFTRHLWFQRMVYLLCNHFFPGRKGGYHKEAFKHGPQGLHHKKWHPEEISDLSLLLSELITKYPSKYLECHEIPLINCFS